MEWKDWITLAIATWGAITGTASLYLYWRKHEHALDMNVQFNREVFPIRWRCIVDAWHKLPNTVVMDEAEVIKPKGWMLEGPDVVKGPMVKPNVAAPAEYTLRWTGYLVAPEDVKSMPSLDVEMVVRFRSLGRKERVITRRVKRKLI